MKALPTYLRRLATDNLAQKELVRALLRAIALFGSLNVFVLPFYPPALYRDRVWQIMVGLTLLAVVAERAIFEWSGDAHRRARPATDAPFTMTVSEEADRDD